jgi:hypothetical protein
MNKCALLIKKNGYFVVCFNNLNTMRDNITKGPMIYSKLQCQNTFNNMDNVYVSVVCVMNFDQNFHLVYNTANFSHTKDWEYLVA